MQFQKLNDAQIQAVRAPLCPTLVLAGAGSGKTRVLTNRIVYLVKECNANPSEILAITFTNKAASEMKSRLFDFDCGAQYMHISTIHSFCASVLRREAEQLNRRSNFSIYTEEDKRSVLKKVVKAIDEEADSKTVDSFSDIISDIKNNASEVLEALGGEHGAKGDNAIDGVPCQAVAMESMDRVMRYADDIGRDKFVYVLKEYQRKMAENNALDFDDLLYYVHKLFSCSKDILEKYRNRYKHILIDEFQDTNRVQYEIFCMLAGRKGNIFVVGDDDQSIYSWRGADIGNILNFEKDFDGAQVYKLEQNYRSTKRILDVANAVIARNSDRYPKQLWTDNEDGVRVELHSAYSEQDECYYVMQQINGLRYANGYKWSDFAVLMRVNALSRVFEQQFNGAGIPYKVFGGFKFFERREIKDILSYMQIVDNPFNKEALFRALNVPVKRGIGDATLAKLSQLSADYGMSVMDVISDERNMAGVISSTAIAKLTQFYQLYSNLCDIAQKATLTEFVHTLLTLVPFRQTCIEDNDEERALNVDALEQSAIDFDASMGGVAKLSDFLQSASLVADKDTAEGTTDYVTLATVHAVKGLEYKCVFVVGLDEGIFPSARASVSFKGSEEERRLMYVAATRAQQRLYLTRAASRYMYGQRKSTLASKFFKEVQQLLAPPKDPVGSGQYNTDRYVDNGKFREVERPAPTPKNKLKLSAGQQVEHPTFGRGIVLNCVNDVADVVFESVGKKTLAVAFAPLKVVGKN